MLDNIFTPLDEHLSLLAAKLDKGASSLLPQIVKRLSAEVRDGSSCIDLSESIDTVNDLKKSSIVGNPGDDLPFILTEDSLLYLGRYYHYECVLSELLNKMASISFPKDSDTTLETIKDPEQKLAVQTALTKRLTIISGGPGTGKTWTAAQIIIALLKTGVSKVAVAAPTGKAANRLNESLQKTIPSELPETISTIHKLLGIRMDGSTRYHETNKLPYNSVIIDEASMVDL
ncbi:MAG: AAA family ATPase, partial [Fibrobacteres bacterium]|nr:AAA family ATPase [Fibrobacterota bacterium]